MYPISDELKKLFLDGNKKCCKLTLNNATTENFVITEADILSDSLTVDRYCSSGNKIEVGSAIAAELTLTLLNNDGKFNDITFEGSEVSLEIGIDGVGDSYIPCGKFTIDEPPRSLQHIKLRALDFMMLFDRKVNASKIQGIDTIENLLVKCCEVCNVDLWDEVAIKSLPNCDQTIKVPAADITYRQIVQWIAQLTGTCAFMDWDGKLRLSWFKDSGVVLDPTNRYMGGTLDENNITIKGVCIKTQNTVVTTEDGVNPVVIESNQLLYSDDETYLEAIANNIATGIGALTYRPFQCNTIPMPFLYPLDIVSYEMKVEEETVVIPTVITNHNFGLNKASALSAVGETATQSGYSSVKGLSKAEIDAAIRDAMAGVDAKAEHIHIKYSQYETGVDINGKAAMTDKPDANTEYLGTCATNSTSPPDTPSSYKWAKIRGADGYTPVKDKDYFDGDDGEPGRGVSKVETEYRLSTSDTSLSSGYTWGTDAPTWQDGLFLWTRLATTYTDNTTEYSDPVVDASWKKTSVVDAASKELNETLANALGLHVKEYTVGTSKIRYYHSNPSLTDSKSGDTILVFNSNGFGVCKTGWNNGNPQFTYGATFDGKAVWDILTANKISADLIEAGSIKSLPAAEVQAVLDLETGGIDFDTPETFLSINNKNKSIEGILLPFGLCMGVRHSNRVWVLSGSHGLMHVDTNYIKELQNFENGTSATKPEDPYYVDLQEQHLKIRDIHSKNIFVLDSDNTEYNLISELKSMGALVVQTSAALEILQQKYLALEEAVGQQHEHAALPAVKENVVDATCKSKGSFDSVIYCVCGEKLSRTTHTTEEVPHTYNPLVIKAPTCSEPGIRYQICTVCNEQYEESIPATGHTDSNGDGYCDVCGLQLSNEELTITEGVTKTVNIAQCAKDGGGNAESSDFTFVKFVPTVSGTYQFEAVSSTGDGDTFGRLYDSTKSYYHADDDESGEGSNFLFTYDCTANTTYYLAVKFYYAAAGSGTADLLVTHLSSGGGNEGGDSEIDTKDITFSPAFGDYKIVRNGTEIIYVYESDGSTTLTFNIGDSLEITYMPDSGYVLGTWYGDNNYSSVLSHSNPCPITVDSSTTSYITNTGSSS